MIQLKIRNQPAVKVKFGYNIKIAEIMSLDQKKYSHLKEEIETHPLFRKLYMPPDGNKRVIVRRRFSGTDISSKCLELNDRVLSGAGPFDMAQFLSEQKDAVPVIEKIGIEKFKQYFLFNELNISVEEIARECRINYQEVQKMNNFMNEFLLKSEFAGAPIDFDYHSGYHRIAAIERDEKEQDEFIIKYFSAYTARGEYVIDYEKLRGLKEKNVFSKQEQKKIDELIGKIKLINSRELMIYRIIKEIVSIQKKYLVSNDIRELVPFTQKKLAMKINGHPSTINRAIMSRSIVTPWGEEKPLKDFLPGKKQNLKLLIKKIISSEPGALTDSEITDILREKYFIFLSRRTVAKYRKEQNISSSFKR